MPRLPSTPCPVSGCAQLQPCPDHPAKTRPGYRGGATKQGYGAAWERLRRRVLWDEPLCRQCLSEGIVTPATDLDHIVPRPEGGDERENLQPLCHSHHSQKTRRESKIHPPLAG